MLGQIAAIIVAVFALDVDLPVPALLGVLIAEFAFNVGAFVWIRRQPSRLGEGHVATQLFADLTVLTALLFLSGGPENPFNFLYLVHVALACSVASARLAWVVALVSSIAFGGLFFYNVPLTVGGMPSMGHGAHAGHGGHADTMTLHLRGMWVAFVVAAGFIVYFVTRVQTALRGFQARAQRAERLAALGTLAAGAAHELATPLASIAIAARELERGANDETREDIAAIRSQVDRCRDVLRRMSSEVGLTAGEGARTTTLPALIHAALDGLQGAKQVRVDADDVTMETLIAPVVSALRPLIDNALDATAEQRAANLRATDAKSQEKSCVHVRAFRDSEFVHFQIMDTGSGLTREATERVGEPFFTTKPVGAGVGLGVYVARSIAEQLGGELTIESESGQGTTATLRIPFRQRSQ